MHRDNSHRDEAVSVFPENVGMVGVEGPAGCPADFFVVQVRGEEAKGWIEHGDV